MHEGTSIFADPALNTINHCPRRVFGFPIFVIYLFDCHFLCFTFYLFVCFIRTYVVFCKHFGDCNFNFDLMSDTGFFRKVGFQFRDPVPKVKRRDVLVLVHWSNSLRNSCKSFLGHQAKSPGILFFENTTTSLISLPYLSTFGKVASSAITCGTMAH